MLLTDHYAEISVSVKPAVLCFLSGAPIASFLYITLKLWQLHRCVAACHISFVIWCFLVHLAPVISIRAWMLDNRQLKNWLCHNHKQNCCHQSFSSSSGLESLWAASLKNKGFPDKMQPFCGITSKKLFTELQRSPKIPILDGLLVFCIYNC